MTGGISAPRDGAGMRTIGKPVPGPWPVLAPAGCVIGGGVSEAGELLLEPARGAFERALPGRGYRPLAEIKVAQRGEDAGIVGAADLARESGQTAVFTRRRRPRRRLGHPILGRSYAARVWRSL